MRLSFLANIHITLVLTIVLPLLLVTGAGIYWGLNVVQAHEQERLREDLALVARATRYPLSRAIESNDYVQVNDITTSVFSIGRIYGVSVYDRRGDRVSQVGVADADVRDSEQAADAVAHGDELGVFREIEGEAVFSHFTPLFSEDGRIIGLLQLTRQSSDFDQRLKDLQANAWWIWGMMAGAILLVAVAGHYGGIGRYVDRLLEAMNRIGAGVRSIRVPDRGPREVRNLATALNEMLVAIEAAEHEIHERQAREVELNERLQHQEKMAMIGRVAGGVAHELGAPLSVIEGRARILERRNHDDTLSRHITDIRTQVQRMTRIIRQLLDCFRDTPRELHTELRLDTVLDACRQVTTAEAQDHGVQLTIRNHAGDVRVLGDQTRLELAVTNLVRNAIHAASSRVEVDLYRESERVAVTVADDGPGIADDQRETVFEPFYTTKPAGEGTGLGLAVVKSVTQEHQGEIRLDASDYGGLAVTLIWPLADEVVHEQQGETT